MSSASEALGHEVEVEVQEVEFKSRPLKQFDNQAQEEISQHHSMSVCPKP